MAVPVKDPVEMTVLANGAPDIFRGGIFPF